MKLKHWKIIFHVIVDENSILQHVIQIKNEIMINANVSVEFIARAKEIIPGVLTYVFVRIVCI